MPSNISLFTQAKQFAEDASVKAEEYSGLFGQLKETIIENFGQNGLIAAYIVFGALAVFVFSKLATMTFSAVKYLVIPSLAMAFIVSLVLPYSFFTALPVTVTACSLFMLFKG